MSFGVNSGGSRENLPGSLRYTAFGEHLFASLSSAIEAAFPYSINGKVMKTKLLGSGSTSHASSLASLKTGAAASSSCTLQSIRVLRYHPGIGARWRGTAIFSTGVANSSQILGIGNASDGFFFGYNGTAFGLLHRKGGELEITKLTVSAPSSGGGDVTITLDDDAFVVTLSGALAVEAVASEIAADTFLGWTPYAYGDEVWFVSHKAEAKAGTYSFVDTDTTGAAAAFVEQVAAVASTDTWVSQTAWSEDVMDGTGPSKMTLDPTKGNVYQICYQWLGFGMISFYMEDSTTGDFQLVHKLQYANANTATSINNPSLPICCTVENTTNDTDVVLKVPSLAAFVEGENDDHGPRFVKSNAKAGITTETSILTIRNNLVAGSIENRSKIVVKFLSLATETGNKVAAFRVVRGATLGGSPSYASVDTDSIVSFDVAGTTVTGGDELFAQTLSQDSSDKVFLNNGLVIELFPGETLTFAGGSALSSDMTAAMSWVEII